MCCHCGTSRLLLGIVNDITDHTICNKDLNGAGWIKSHRKSRPCETRYWLILAPGLVSGAWALHYTVSRHVLTFCSSLPGSRPANTMWLIPWWNSTANHCGSTQLTDCIAATKFIVIVSGRDKRRYSVLALGKTPVTIDMTEKIQIRGDAQENGLCVCIAKLPLVTQLQFKCMCVYAKLLQQ